MPPRTISVRDIRGQFGAGSPFHSPQFQNKKEAEAAAQAVPDERIEINIEERFSSDEAKLNKTEKRFLAILRGRGFDVKIHALTFKLAHDTRYTPEFMVVDNGRIVIWEVKGGFIREDAWIKLKVAARMFPEFVFKMAQEEDKVWTEKEVRP